MITYGTEFVKSCLPRDFMLNAEFVNPARPALPADLHLTRCPNALLLRLPSTNAGHPSAAGYAERRIKVGCRNCEVCDLDAQVKRVLTWSQRLKAVAAYEVQVRESHMQFVSLTFPKHPDGDEARDYAPTEEMVQEAWALFRRRLSHWYNRRGDKMSSACNLIGFLEEGEERSRRHLHLLAAFRPGIKHPYEVAERVSLGTRDRNGNLQYLCGFGQLWRDTLDRLGYASLRNWYRAPVESPAQIAGYVTSKYLTKGFFSGAVYRVRAGQQNPPWPELLSWYRDKRFALEQGEYRRWVGFRIVMNEVNEDNLTDIARRLAQHYAHSYMNYVKVSGQRVPRIDVNALAKAFLVGYRHRDKRKHVDGLDRAMSNASQRRRLFGEPAGLAMSLHIQPVLIALSDRPVTHPAKSDYLSVSYYSDTGDFGPVEQVNRPRVLIEEDDRFNLCGASHWFPMDTPVLNVRDTEAFEELVEWNMYLVTRFNDICLRILNQFLPGNAWSFLSQGMSAPVDILDEERLNRVASAFPEVFPDQSLRVQSAPAQRVVKTHDVTLSPVHSEIAGALERCRHWNEPSVHRASDTHIPGDWPDFFLKQGQLEILRRLHAVGYSEDGDADGIYCLPTSFGKSLCYQLSDVAGGVTLVVSPLLSLIRDQVARLEELGVNATWIGGMHDKHTKTARLEEVGALGYPSPDDEPCIVYCAPEAFDITAAGEERLLARFLREGYLPVSHLVVDEAHCITEWSDFRPAYRKIPDAVDTWFYRPKCISLFSATVSPRILEDLRASFGGNLPFYGLPIRRPNLFLRRSALGFYDFFASAFGDLHSPILIYCGQRARTEEVASFLRAQDINAAHYHAGLESDRRVKVEEDFRNGRIDVLCATIAYGMGIDIRNVRAVIHDSYPQSLEDYVQQAGRGGRDGRRTECILLNNPGMVASPDMWAYFHSPECLWVHIARHHGQPAEPCGHCDVCESELAGG